MPTKSVQHLIQEIPVNNSAPLLLHAPSIVRELHINQNDIRMFGYNVKDGSEGHKHIFNLCGSMTAQSLSNTSKGVSLPIKTPIGVTLTDLSAGFLSNTFPNLEVLKIKEPTIQLASVPEYTRFISQSGLDDLVSQQGLFKLLANLDTVAFMVQYPLNNKMTSVNITIHRESIISTADNLPLPRPYICLHSRGQGLRAACEQAVLLDLRKKKTRAVLDINANIFNDPDILKHRSTRAAVCSALMNSPGCTQLCKIGDSLQPQPTQQSTTQLAQKRAAQQSVAATVSQPISKPAQPIQSKSQPIADSGTSIGLNVGDKLKILIRNVFLVFHTAFNALRY